MSATSVRRLKERGVAGGKITASMPTKTLTPVSEKPSLGSAKKFAGKENPNPRSISKISGPSQKPTIKPMPRMSNEPRSKSRPRGRSPSPSDFTQILSDLRKTRVPSDGGLVGNSGWGASGSRVLEKQGTRDLGHGVSEKGVNGLRIYTDEKEDGNAGEKSKNSGKKVVGEESAVSKLHSAKCRNEDALPVNYLKSNVHGIQYASDGCIGQCNKDGSFSAIVADHKGENANRNAILKPDNALFMQTNEAKWSFKQSGLRNASNLKVSDVCKEKGVNAGEMSLCVDNKHATRLQEKLAYLEGKVKKIASDIKKTKEILDMNNTDASKVMLLDIQEKISGIEGAMGNALTDFNVNVNSECSDDYCNSERIITDMMQTTAYGTNQNRQAEPSKLPVKSLGSEDLEARLFPHHKLLRNRTSLKLTALGSEGNANHVAEANSGSNSKNSISSIDEKLIAMEFLASLKKEQPWVSVTDAGIIKEVEETEGAETSTTEQSSSSCPGKQNAELDLQADERLDDFDDRENKPAMTIEEEIEDDSVSQLMEIGHKTSTGGWFVSEGESVLLAHDDGSCSFYDVGNREEKAEYRPPAGISKNLWKDCWIIRAPSADGCSGKYVVAASAGNTIDSGFCSWDFYSKEVRAFHAEDNGITSRVAVGSLTDNNRLLRRNALADITPSENRQWWYRPCGPLMISTASCQRAVKVFDVRDGEEIMKWDVQKPVLAMDYCSPLQWRNREKIVVAETEGVSLWDVSSQNPQALSSVSSAGCRISAVHVNNTDAELGGGVRQRVSSSEAEGNDGVFCTDDSINVLDFRHPLGIGLKIPKIGVSADSVFSQGDSVFLGCSCVGSAAKKQVSSQVLHFSLRKQRIVSTYELPESNAHAHHKALTQVWGNSNLVMAVCGLGLFVFNAVRDEGSPSFAADCSTPQKAKEVIGPDDLYLPSFDYLSSQILLISRDRPAMWRHLL